MEQLQCLNLDDMTDKTLGSSVSGFKRDFSCSRVPTGLCCAGEMAYESS